MPEPTSSSGFNRYRYARNNPLRYTDPSGHCGVSFGGGASAVMQQECIDVGGGGAGPVIIAGAATVVLTKLVVEGGKALGDVILPQGRPVQLPTTSGGVEGKIHPPLTEEIPLLEGNQATIETVPANPPGNSSILDPFERPDNLPLASSASSNDFPFDNLRGKSVKQITRNKPKGWRTEPTRNHDGWIWKDENNVERLRFMRGTGNNPTQEQWSRQSTGYFIWKDGNNNYLDIDGNIISDDDIDRRWKRHIPYEGP